ncbi:MAG: thiol reductant ABC exporter subunit CydC, partial [Acidimicrobiales bacterium]
ALRRAFAAGVLVTGSSVGLAGTSAWLIVRAAERPAVLSLAVPMGLVQLFALAKAAGRYLERTQTHRAALSVMGHVRASVARLLEPLVPAGLGPHSADVVDTVLGDVERVQDLLTAVAGPLLTSAVAGLVTLAVTGLIVPLSAIALATGLVVTGALLPFVAARCGANGEEELDEVHRALVTLAARAAQSGDEYVMAGATDDLLEQCRALEERFDRADTRRSLVRGAMGMAATLVAGGSVLAATLFSARALAEHRITPSLLAVPALMSVAALELLGGIAPTLVGLGRDRRSLQRVEGLAAVVAPVREPTLDGPATVGETVTLDAVTLSYGDTRVLDGLSLHLAPGEVLLVRGPSGGGKTTLARLIAKFLDPTTGRLALDQVDYASLRSAQVRASVGFVDDAPYVFATTLAGNLRVAVPTASDDELRAALEVAGLGPLLANAPEGLSTSLGGGGGLSGGERRRLGVAREVLADRRVVVLDEPTEGLDEESADKLRESLAKCYADAALIVISHLDRDEAYATATLELSEGVVRAAGSSVGSASGLTS